MNLKLNQNITRGDIELKKDEVYKIADIVQKDYIIEIPMKQKGKFRYALVKNDEGILVE